MALAIFIGDEMLVSPTPADDYLDRCSECGIYDGQARTKYATTYEEVHPCEWCEEAHCSECPCPETPDWY